MQAGHLREDVRPCERGITRHPAAESEIGMFVWKAELSPSDNPLCLWDTVHVTARSFDEAYKKARRLLKIQGKKCSIRAIVREVPLCEV